MKRLAPLFCLAPLALVTVAHAQTAQVKAYKVSASLREVSNLKAFNKAIPVQVAQRQMLARNLFVATPTSAQQLFHIYENNDYLNVPSFITSDGVLQLYHIFFDFTLRKVESESLFPILKTLTGGMVKQSIATWRAAPDADLKAAALKNIAYFGTASRLLGLSTPLPPEAAPFVQKELALIAAHEGFAQGAIFPYRFDYSQFVPRGHYTRSPELQRFFKAMMWYGLAPFSIRTDGQRNDEQIRQGLLLSRDLYVANLNDEWATIYEPTAFYVGLSDDLTPGEWKTAADKVFGVRAPLSEYSNPARFEVFVAAAENLRPARITPRFGLQQGIPKDTPNMIQGPLPSGSQLRFMGQRYIPDSEIMQRLVTPVQRVFPSGLDVMAVLGSNRASTILDAYPQIYNAKNWSGYKAERTKLTQEFARLPQSTWTSNLYWSWLHVLRAVNAPAPAGYPSFMRNTAWQDKQLNTALASWSQLRHDTLLYGKQSVVQCGGDGEDKPFVKGYVEPNVLFWDRLLKLTQQSRGGLVKRKLLSNELKDKFEEFENMLSMLKRISQKELRNQKLTKEEYEEIRYLGGKLDYLTLSVMSGSPSNWELVSQTDRDMATVADVHTGGDRVLEEGVGHAYELLAIVPIEGKLVLTRGAAFSYYEFKHPASDRLTDEKWQAMLRSNRAPLPPVWTKSFVVPVKSRLKVDQLAGYDSGC